MVLDIQTHTLSLLRQQRIPEAEEQLRRLAATSSTDGPLQALHALCLAELDHWLEAADAARRAVVIDQQQAYAHWAFAMVRLVSQEFRKARVAAAKAVKLNPNDADYLHALARAEAGQQNWDEAVAALESGLRVDPDHEGCRQLRAAIHELRGKPDASDEFLLSITRNPPEAIARAARIWSGIEPKSSSAPGVTQASPAAQAGPVPAKGRGERRRAPRRARNHFVLGGVVVAVSLGIAAMLTGAASVGVGAMVCGFALLPLVGMVGVNRTGRAPQS